ncbi:MAG: PaaI family thioesterase [Planctomycetaceae bacterium]|jgi:acyl-CoA thioesterase|nr:PaaI family thioesterase [Planctomycetaceae bacterium]
MDNKYNQWLELFKKDHFATQVVGIDIVDASPGYARTVLDIEPRHHNAVGITQGGVIFTLADFALAVASHVGHNDTLVAIECNIAYLKPVTSGKIYGEAKEVAKSKSLAYYEVEIKNDTNDLIAKFNGRVFVRRQQK